MVKIYIEFGDSIYNERNEEIQKRIDEYLLSIKPIVYNNDLVNAVSYYSNMKSHFQNIEDLSCYVYPWDNGSRIQHKNNEIDFHYIYYIIPRYGERKRCYKLATVTRDINYPSLVHVDVSKAREYLLKRICERHALNETMVQSMKKKLEIERIYYKLKELHDEEYQLTNSINTKREQLNSLKEDICSKKVELDRLDMRILQSQNELEALAYHHKQMELATEINAEVTLLEDDKELMEAKRMHEYYTQFANDLKVYKFAFDHMREISLKLEQEKDEFEKHKVEETKALENKLNEIEDKIKHREEQFDQDCEKYEIEATKWKTFQESKFSKYQEQIDNYDRIVEENNELEQKLVD